MPQVAAGAESGGRMVSRMIELRMGIAKSELWIENWELGIGNGSAYCDVELSRKINIYDLFAQKY